MRIHGRRGEAVRCVNRNRGKETGGRGNDVCWAGEVNKIEVVL